MKLQRPLVLLLGGLLSASSVGCAAVTAVVSDTRPAARQSRGTADRMVAVARVFESQGRYDQAEAMYRKALKQRPNDSAIRSQLAQLSSRKNGKTFSGNSQDSAIAAAAAGNPAATGSGVKESSSKASVVSTLSSKPQQAPHSTDGESPLIGSALAPLQSPIPVGAESPVLNAVASAASMPSMVQTVSAEASPVLAAETEKRVTAEQILAVVDVPADHSELLLNGLRYGDSLETQCLAATLLGDCSPADESVSKALRTAGQAAADPRLRLAICDSRIQRGEHDEFTAGCLIELLSHAPNDVQLQACSYLRHFKGTSSESAGVDALVEQLGSDAAQLRACAALTLGDFDSLPQEVMDRLKSMSEGDGDISAREAAGLALHRRSATTDNSNDIVISPRGE